MRRMNLLIMLILLFVVPYLFGCAPNNIKGTEKVYDVAINIHNNHGPVILTSPLKVESASETTQDANPSTVISPETALAMPSGGSTASIAAQASTQALKDVASKLVNDLSKKDSENPTTNDTTSTTNNVAGNQVVKDEESGISPDAASDTETSVDPAAVYAKSETFVYYNVGDGGRMAWRIPKKGPDFGKTIKAVFADGYTVVIPDTSVRFALKNGFIYRPGTDKKGSPTNSIETSHGGVYMYAPTGNQSKSVTYYY